MIARICFCIGLLAMATAPAAAQPTGAAGGKAVARSLEVNGARIHYQVSGAGPTVVLLHGGLFGSIEEFAPLMPALTRKHRVIAIALRGHGVSEMGSEPLSNQRFARDAAAIIRHESRDPVDVIGFSTGAMTSYFLVLDAPSLVRSMVAIGGPISAAGSTEAGRAESEIYATPERLDALYPGLVAKRKRLYPNPEDWNRLVKSFAAMATGSDIADAAVRTIRQPVLILAGDRDHYTRTDHFVHIAQLLPRGSLAIVPECGHVVLACKPAIVRDLIVHFLDRAR